MPVKKRLQCFCYIVACADGSFYTGWTSDPERRLQAHNAGRGSRYTRSRRPVQLVHLEPQINRSSAMKRERAIKAMTRSRKLRLIAQSQAAPLRPKRKARRPGARSIRE
ncbi:MAG: GIY-YIG nuclease family protein [Chloroflexota bacterium]